MWQGRGGEVEWSNYVSLQWSVMLNGIAPLHPLCKLIAEMDQEDYYVLIPPQMEGSIWQCKKRYDHVELPWMLSVKAENHCILRL